MGNEGLGIIIKWLYHQGGRGITSEQDESLIRKEEPSENNENFKREERCKECPQSSEYSPCAE